MIGAGTGRPLAALLGLLLASCSRRGIEPGTYEGVRGLKDEVTVADGNLTIHNVFKAEVVAVHESRSKSRADASRALVDTVYTPHKSMWEGYVGDEAAFLDWSRKRLDTGRLNDQAKAATREDFGRILQETAGRLSLLSGRTPKGHWYVLFGPGWTDLGGIGEGRMVIDLATPAVDAKRVTYVMPHELNHQIYDDTSKADPLNGTVLHRCVNEGFASLVNRIYWGEAGPAKSLLYSEAEYAWCLAHEKALLEAAAKLFLSTKREDADLVARRDAKLVRGGPGAQGYFVGYRICEEYVRRHGPDSWKEIYDLPVSKVLAESGLTTAP